MKLKKIEKTKEKLVVEVEGENHTLLNLLRENSWKVGAAQASYTIEHPYLVQPKITVISESPAKTLAQAAELAMEDAAAFQKEFKKALKK